MTETTMALSDIEGNVRRNLSDAVMREVETLAMQTSNTYAVLHQAAKPYFPKHDATDIDEPNLAIDEPDLAIDEPDLAIDESQPKRRRRNKGPA